MPPIEAVGFALSRRDGLASRHAGAERGDNRSHVEPGAALQPPDAGPAGNAIIVAHPALDRRGHDDQRIAGRGDQLRHVGIAQVLLEGDVEELEPRDGDADRWADRGQGIERGLDVLGRYEIVRIDENRRGGQSDGVPSRVRPCECEGEGAARREEHIRQLVLVAGAMRSPSAT